MSSRQGLNPCVDCCFEICTGIFIDVAVLVVAVVLLLITNMLPFCHQDIPTDRIQKADDTKKISKRLSLFQTFTFATMADTSNSLRL